MRSADGPLRGEIWVADLEPVRGHEQGGRRPVLVVSHDRLNRSRAQLLFAIPLTTRDKGIPSHVPVDPPEAGLKQRGFVMCEHLRSLSRDRLVQRWGSVSDTTLAAVEQRLRFLLAL